MKKFSTSLYYALDFKEAADAHNILGKINPYIDGIKVGLEFFVSNGPKSVIELKRYDLPIFLDLKLHDIPNTVSKAVNGIMKIKPEILSVHISGGRKMLKEVTCKKFRPKIVGITLLTSLDQNDLFDGGINLSPENYVKRLASIAVETKLDGLVTSVKEAKAVKSYCPDDFLIIIPGIRMELDNLEDQKRVASPKEASKNGASIIVVGRSITNSKNPREVAQEIKKCIR